jgi:hypothetical protein
VGLLVTAAALWAGSVGLRLPELPRHEQERTPGALPRVCEAPTDTTAGSREAPPFIALPAPTLGPPPAPWLRRELPRASPVLISTGAETAATDPSSATSPRLEQANRTLRLLREQLDSSVR